MCEKKLGMDLKIFQRPFKKKGLSISVVHKAKSK